VAWIYKPPCKHLTSLKCEGSDSAILVESYDIIFLIKFQASTIGHILYI